MSFFFEVKADLEDKSYYFQDEVMRATGAKPAAVPKPAVLPKPEPKPIDNSKPKEVAVPVAQSTAEIKREV